MSLTPPEWFMLIVLALVAVVAAVSPLWASRPPAIGRFARTVGLPLDGDEELERTVGERLRFRARWGAVGTVAGAAVGAFVAVSGVLTTHDEFGAGLSPLAGLVLAGLVLTGRGIGTAISTLPAPPEVRRHGPRVARVPRPMVADYVAPIERVGARVLVAVGTLLAITVAVLPTPVESRLLAGGTALAAIAALAAAEWASAALVSRPQPAVSEELLRWDDALRAQTLRDIVSVPLMSGSVVTVAAITAWPEWTGPGATAGEILGSTITLALLIAAIVVAAVSVALRPARYFLKRLWPAQYAESEHPAYGAPASASTSTATPGRA